jgi:predicted N-acetyltransferase YhbS
LERFLAAAPDGCFLAEWNGVPAGTATTIVYSQALAWIGMVLVHPNCRRRGIGRALLGRCIEHLRSHEVRCIKLDATPPGKKVYDALGFEDEWTLTRWERAVANSPKSKQASSTRDCRDADAIESLDVEAFGTSRKKVLEPLLKQAQCALVSETECGRIEGYGLLREGSAACYLGPVVVESCDAAIQLLNALLPAAEKRKVYWDIPDQNGAAVELAKEHDFMPQRTLTRMYLGENATPGDPQRQFAIAGPEIG